MSTPKPRRPWRTLIILFALACVAGFAALAFIVKSAFVELGDDLHDLPVAKLEGYGRFKLPPGAAGVKSHLVSWQDYHLTATFTMPAAEMDDFLKSTFYSPAATTQPELLRSPQGEGDSWWKPGDPVKAFRSHGERGSISQDIQIDQANPQVYQVWISVTTR